MQRQHPLRESATGAKRWLWLAIVTASWLGVSGCSHFGNDMLEITPSVFSECSGTNISVHVSWDATRVVKQGGVRLVVYKPGKQPVLWVQAAPQGSADTGKWASDGWTVTLVDDRGGLLATRTLQSTACPAAGK